MVKVRTFYGICYLYQNELDAKVNHGPTPKPCYTLTRHDMPTNDEKMLSGLRLCRSGLQVRSAGLGKIDHVALQFQIACYTDNAISVKKIQPHCLVLLSFLSTV